MEIEDDIELQNPLTVAVNEASPEGILVVNPEGTIVFYNLRFFEIWQIQTGSLDGIQSGTAIGKHDTQISAAIADRVQDAPAYLARVKELNDNPQLKDHCEIKLRDGRILERNSSALRSDSGQYLGRAWFFRDITRHKQAEENLLLTRFVSDQAPESIFWFDEHARIVYANAAACRNYGYTMTELLDLFITDIDYGSRIEGWHEHWQKLKQEGHLTFETKHRRKNGSIFWNEVFANHIEFEGKEFNIVFARNITERRQAGEHLLITQFVSDQASDSIVWVDEQARIVYANEEMCLERGYTKEELLALHIPDINPDLSYDVWQDQWQKVRQKGSLTFEARHRRKDGSLFPVEVSANFIQFEGNEIVVAFARNVTKRKENAEKLLLTQFVSDHAPLCIIWVDEQARVVYANEETCREHGYTKEEFLSLSIPDFDPDFPVAAWPDHWQELKHKGNLTFESRHSRKDGSIFPIEVSANFVAFAGKEFNVAYVRNIAQRKQAESEQRIAAVAFESQDTLMITDAEGVILRVNQAFTDNTGYKPEDIVGKTPRILKSGRHGAEFYREMWETLKRTGTWRGEVWDRRKNGEIYPKWLTISAVKGSNGAVTHYVGSHIDITARKAAEDEIQHLAFYDPLTNLPNRRLLMDRLMHATASSARSGRKGALLFIDLDQFKTLNDTLGHDIGDLLLQQVAQRLESCVREGDTVARLGGDEFVLILEDLNDQADEAGAQAEAISEHVLTTLTRPYLLDSHECRSTPSIGITLFSGHQTTLEELMKQADIAMYQAKKAGRNTVRFFDPKMQASINAHADLESELRRAIEMQQFQLYYQVQVDSSQHVLGVEALIRWKHPERGLIPPGQFIPLAEETGLILPIGDWVLDKACAQLKLWQQDPLTRDFALSINLSAKRFHQPGYAAHVQAAVLHHGINPGLLKIELTESLLLENIEDAITTMSALNDIGVSLSLDDFGTGYSSLQYLKRLPLDQLKIDQSFVRELATDSNDKTIVRTIIAMAKNLDLEVIAEGVETKEQRSILLSLGCENYQGYLFSKPIPIEEFEAVLRQGKASF